MSGLLAPENSVEVTRGTTRTLDFVLRDDRDNILNLSASGIRIVFSVKRFLTDPVPLVQKTNALSGGVVVTSAVEGKIRVTLTPTDTKNLEIGTFLFDIWVVYPAVVSPPAAERRYQGIPTSNLEVVGSVTVLV